MPFVVDTSVAGAWLLPDERSVDLEALGDRLRDDVVVVPDLFVHESRNLLVFALRRGRLARETFDEALARAARLPVEIVSDVDVSMIIDLAIRHALTAYDAVCLALAIERSLALATLDKALRRAAMAENVTLLPA